MSKIEGMLTSKECALQSAYYRVVENGIISNLLRTFYDIMGRFNQNYPGEYVSLLEVEIRRYPHDRINK